MTDTELDFATACRVRSLLNGVCRNANQQLNALRQQYITDLKWLVVDCSGRIADHVVADRTEVSLEIQPFSSEKSPIQWDAEKQVAVRRQSPDRLVSTPAVREIYQKFVAALRLWATATEFAADLQWSEERRCHQLLYHGIVIYVRFVFPTDDPAVTLWAHEGQTPSFLAPR